MDLASDDIEKKIGGWKGYYMEVYLVIEGIFSRYGGYE